MNKTAKTFFTLSAMLLAVFLIGSNQLKSFSLTGYDELIVEFNPKSPGPNTTVKANLITYSFDPDMSLITWKLNGKIIEQGRGKKSAEITTGDVGSTLYLYIYVITEKNRQIEKSFTFRTGEIDFLAQASSYTPPFYKGAAKVIVGAPVKITAVPHGFGSAENLIYEWRRNYSNVASASGLGRNSFSFEFSYMNTEEVIDLTLYGPNREFSFEKRITVRPSRPEIIFYEEHPLEGALFNNALAGELNLSGKSDVSIRAEPYFYPTKDLPVLSLKWAMNEEKISPLSAPNLIGLTVPETGESGSSLISLDIENPKNFFEKAANMIRINF